jgi:hypothetical protein
LYNGITTPTKEALMLTVSEVPCVDRRDYQIRISGISPETAKEALACCGALSQEENPVRVNNNKASTLVWFSQKCEPKFVEDVYFSLMQLICPNINEGLLESFEPAQYERAIA